ncbi:MAG: hypothetical protein KC467_16125, partial [Marinomonas atlantica]|nr:hypothetical protein [Marinomonas atlantica]
MIIRNLIRLEFAGGGELLLTDGGVPVTHLDYHYVPDAYLKDIGDVEEQLELNTQDWEITLAVENTTSDAVLYSFRSASYLNQKITYYRQYVWDDDTIEFYKLFEGKMIGYEEEDAEEGTSIVVTSSANIIHWQQVKGRKTNSDSQQQ